MYVGPFGRLHHGRYPGRGGQGVGERAYRVAVDRVLGHLRPDQREKVGHHAVEVAREPAQRRLPRGDSLFQEGT